MTRSSDNKERKEDFDHIASLLEIESEDDAHKVLMKETKNGKRDMITFIIETREVLNNLSPKDSDGNTLTLYQHWKICEGKVC